MVKWAAMLQVSWSIDFTHRANVPLAVNVDMSKVVTLKARLMIAQMVAGKRGVNRNPV